MTLRELRPAFAIFFSLGLTGCIFLVDSLPDDTSTTCNLTTPPFSDGTNACKTCITNSCQSALNSCCGDTACQAQLNNVDSCANGEGCSTLAQAGGTEGATSDLISCIENNCGTKCYGIDAGPASDGSTSACIGACPPVCVSTSDQSECSCSVGSQKSGNTVTAVCPSSSNSNSVCCATSEYPGVVGGSCTCQALYCEDEGDGICNCELGATGSSTTTSCFPSGGSSSCCLSADRGSCSCDPSNDCSGSGELAVEYCATDQWTCPNGQSSLVTDCYE